MNKVKNPVLKWDVDDAPDHFKHRIVLFDGDVIVKEGPWYSYRGIAQLSFEGRRFCAATSYHEGGLPIEKIFEVSENPTWNTRSLVVAAE